MFTKTAEILGLISLAPDSDILAPFDKDVQTGMVRLLCKQFSSSNDLSTYMKSDAHCQWIMEVIGAGFKLDLEEGALISQCIDIYEFGTMSTTDSHTDNSHSTITKARQAS